MPRTLLLILLGMVLSACSQPPGNLVPIGTYVAQTLTALPSPTPVVITLAPVTPTAVATKTPPAATPTRPQPPTLVPTAATPTDCLPTRGKVESGQVVRVIDGDTIVVNINKQDFRVRYIGVDTPEPKQPFGPEAAEQNRLLVEGKTVVLVKDVSEVDRYGRLLRYVLVDDVFVNYRLVQQGFAYPTTYPPDVACQETFAAAGQLARQQSQGLWGMVFATQTSNPTPYASGQVAPCPCTGPDLDCADFASRQQSQACFDYCKLQGYGDIFRLDGDSDGLTCERMP